MAYYNYSRPLEEKHACGGSTTRGALTVKTIWNADEPPRFPANAPRSHLHPTGYKCMFQLQGQQASPLTRFDIQLGRLSTETCASTPPNQLTAVWVYVCMYIYIYIYMCVCVCVWIYIYICVCVWCLYCVCVLCVRCICVCVCIYIYRYICVMFVLCLCVVCAVYVCVFLYVCVSVTFLR